MEEKYDWLTKKKSIIKTQDIQSSLNSLVICFIYLLDKATFLQLHIEKIL